MASAAGLNQPYPDYLHAPPARQRHQPGPSQRPPNRECLRLPPPINLRHLRP